MVFVLVVLSIRGDIFGGRIFGIYNRGSVPRGIPTVHTDTTLGITGRIRTTYDCRWSIRFRLLPSLFGEEEGSGGSVCKLT